MQATASHGHEHDEQRNVEIVRECMEIFLHYGARQRTNRCTPVRPGRSLIAPTGRFAKADRVCLRYTLTFVTAVGSATRKAVTRGIGWRLWRWPGTEPSW